MSFQQSHARGHGAGSYQSATGGDSAYVRAVQDIQANVFTVSRNVQTLKQMCELLGSPRDGPELRDEIQRLQTATREMAVTTKTAVKSLSEFTGGSDTEARKRRQTQSQLNTELKDSVTIFRGVIQDIVRQERVHVPRAPVGDGGMGDDFFEDDAYADETARLLDDQQREEAERQAQEVAYRDDVIEERAEGIRQLEETMEELGELFEDVSRLVVEQGTKLNTIKDHVLSTHDHVESGTQNLGKAAKYQKKARNKMCILLIIVAVVAAILTIVLVSKSK